MYANFLVLSALSETYVWVQAAGQCNTGVLASFQALWRHVLPYSASFFLSFILVRWPVTLSQWKCHQNWFTAIGSFPLVQLMMSNTTMFGLKQACLLCFRAGNSGASSWAVSVVARGTGRDLKCYVWKSRRSKNVVWVYALSPGPHQQACRGWFPPRASPVGCCREHLWVCSLPSTRVCLWAMWKRSLTLIHPLLLRKTAQTLWRSRQLSFSDWSPVFSLPGGGGTKVVTYCCTSRTIKPRTAAMVAQPLGCATGSSVTGRWLLLQDMAAGVEGAVPPPTSIQGWRPCIRLSRWAMRQQRASWREVFMETCVAKQRGYCALYQLECF